MRSSKMLSRVALLRTYVSEEGIASIIRVTRICAGETMLAVTINRITNKTKQTPWPLVRERTIPTERPPLVDEI
jgi:hypothetical protein